MIAVPVFSDVFIPLLKSGTVRSECVGVEGGGEGGYREGVMLICTTHCQLTCWYQHPEGGGGWGEEMRENRVWESFFTCLSVSLSACSPWRRCTACCHGSIVLAAPLSSQNQLRSQTVLPCPRRYEQWTPCDLRQPRLEISLHSMGATQTGCCCRRAGAATVYTPKSATST